MNKHHKYVAIDEKILYQLYFIEKLSLTQMENRLKINRCTIEQRLKEYGFKLRDKFLAIKLVCVSGILNPKYNPLSKTHNKCPDCGKKITFYAIRCKSCAHKGKLAYNFRGGEKRFDCIECGAKVWQENAYCNICKAISNRNSNWKGGITSLYSMIRNSSKYADWRTKCFIRDNYTCQKCGRISRGNIEVHHVKLFNKILHEFLQVYSKLNPLEDKKNLFELVLNYKPLWDLENGKTLCYQCHHKKGYKLS